MRQFWVGAVIGRAVLLLFILCFVFGEVALACLWNVFLRSALGGLSGRSLNFTEGKGNFSFYTSRIHRRAEKMASLFAAKNSHSII